MTTASPAVKPAAYPLTAKITVVAEQNPKAKGSLAAGRFKIYKTGMSVAAYIEAAGKKYARADLIWDVRHGFITVA